MNPAPPAPRPVRWPLLLTGVVLMLACLGFLAWRGPALWQVLQPFVASGLRLKDQNAANMVTSAAGQVLGALIALLVGYKLLRLSRRKPAASPEPGAAADLAPESRTTSRSSRRSTAQRWHSCNVLDAGADARRVWQFDAGSGSFALNRVQSSRPGEPLPGNLVGKSWGAVFRPRLNVAWLAPENVFIRVAHFPHGSAEETRAMVELQLEKLSPIPVTQAVWSMHVLQTGGELQTVVVLFVARNLVEEFLGRLEGAGYVADRLELPLLDQLQAAPVRTDGAWIIPESHGLRNTALVAWWYGGVLHNVGLLTLPVGADRATALKEQLMQMAWAGELDGWLTAAPRWHLVGDEAIVGEWEKPLQQGLEQPVDVVPPLPAAELAARTARRAAQADPANNLLPAEFAVRYRQQFVDRLWMRGLFSALALYGVGLLVYFVALAFLNVQTKRAEARVAGVSGDYTNALVKLAQYQILGERQELKYAALECYLAVAETLPENMSLDSYNFGESRTQGGGRMLQLTGTAPAGEVNTVFDFGEKLHRATDKQGKPLFGPNWDPPRPTIIPGGLVRWTLDLELKRADRT